ncbi:hypothetical protein [Nocardioides alcanivorans]|uniref:hypothetical protein n=1 Tax=Nocardioides alcanivorans TaxID=2897352 RepID=UPI001F3165F8|nr:hypothetical protein [Nocardioides alcanivorans]
MGRTRRRRLLVAAVTAALLCGFVFSLVESRGQRASSAGATPGDDFVVLGDGSLPEERPPLGAPRDPLSAEETGYAISLATRNAHLPQKATDVLGEPGAEILSAELPASAESTDRMAVVHLYDYTSNTGLQQTVNLSTGTVLTRAHRRMQAPMSTAEASVAVQVAIEHQPALEFLREFEEAQGTPLLSSDQVTAVVGTFVHDGSTLGGASCGKNRCAQLMLRTPSGAYLATWEFVVDLSRKRVLLVNEEGS